VTGLRGTTAATGDGRVDLYDAYHLCRSYLGNLKGQAGAAVCADRGLTLAGEIGDRLLVAHALRNVAMVQLRGGSARQALAVANRALDMVTGVEPDRLVLRGSLRVVAAKASARLRDPAGAEQHLAGAIRAADSLGSDRMYRNLWFGPSDLAISRVRVKLILGATDDALRTSRTAELAEGYPPSLQAEHFINLASAYVHRRQDAAAMYALLKAERLSAEEIRYNDAVASILRSLSDGGDAAIRAEVGRMASQAGTG
jgi:hypothetical protein